MSAVSLSVQLAEMGQRTNKKEVCVMYEFKGFTSKANKALNLAMKSAGDMGHTYIGTEHILLGLVKEGSGVAATALIDAGLKVDELERNRFQNRQFICRYRTFAYQYPSGGRQLRLQLP